MRVYTKAVSTWDEALQRYILIEAESDWYEYEGPVALCKGDSTAQAAEQQQAAFNQQLMTVFNSQYQNQTNILNFLKDKLEPMIDKPTGYSAQAEAALRSGATDTISQQYTNAQQALNNQLAQKGVSPNLPSGVTSQIDASLLNAQAQDQASAQNTISLNNENLKNSNLWNAFNVLSGNVASQFNPLGYAGAATSGGNAVANLSQANTAANGSGFWGSFTKSLGGALGNTLGGGNSTSMGSGGVGTWLCYVAAAVFNEDFYFGHKTNAVRRYLYGVWAQHWYATPVLWLYRKIGKWVATKPLLVTMLAPLFRLALRKAEEN